MKSNDPNVRLLEVVAARLGPELRRELVFVGGAVAGLLITDPAQPAIRPTEDVDLIVQTLALGDYYAIEKRLAHLGFVRDLSADAPICRWRVGAVAVDVMPTLEDILGFSNRWYPLALATKLEAFKGRGAQDYLFSHDLGDAISVIDGREALLDECRSSPIELRSYLAACWDSLLKTPAFLDALPGHLPGDAASQERLPDLLDKLRVLASGG